MNRFVTFCIKIGIALLVLAAISNTSYAATTTETADGDPTMTTGTISAGTYTDTWSSDDGATQDLLEGKVSNKYHLDCYYNLRGHRKITYRNQLVSCTPASLDNIE